MRSCLRTPHPFKRPAITLVEAENRIGERDRIVAHVIAFLDDVAEKRRDAELANRVHVERDGMLTLRRVRAEDRLRGTAAVEDHDVDDEPRVFDDGLQMLLCGVAIALAR